MKAERVGSGDNRPNKHLILAGGGHSHTLVLQMWAMRPERRPRAWITLVSRHSTALYSGMVPGLVAGLYAREACEIDLRHLADQAGASFVQAEITGLELAGQTLLLNSRAPLRFDWLSLDVGAESAAAAGLPIKPLEPFLQWCEQSQPNALKIIGSGAGAVEIALALKARGHRPLVHTKATGLALGSRAANRLLMQVLRQAGILASAAAEAAPTQGTSLNCSGSCAPAWLGASGLSTGPRGRVLCQADLSVVGQPHVFASGDCGVIANDPRPPSGVWAVRAAPVLAANLQRGIAGLPLRQWRPQRRALQLLGDGGVDGAPRAVALWGPLALGPSRWLWRWKDWIDQRFMSRLQKRAVMAEAMACSGCAAKLGSEPLQEALEALARLAPEGPPTAQLLVQDDAAVIGRNSDGEWLLQSVDGFPALLNDPWLNGRLTALHACSDLWACGARITSVQALVTLPQLGPALQSELLLQTLAGVRSVLDPLGASLLGGHTLEARDATTGKGLSLALTVNGCAPTQRCWAKGALQAGDALILLRPIGTGVLFAAAMAGAVSPQRIDQALAVMQQSQAPVVEVLAAHGCRACTDVTGFGLLGHLGEMVSASPPGTRVELHGEALQTLALPGALALLANGQASTLAPANARALALLEGSITLIAAGTDPVLPQLLIDPQTCGPLLAALPAERAAACLDALHQQGFEQANAIGRVLG